MKIRNPKYPFKQCGPWENCPICFEDFSLTPCTNCGNGFEDEYIEVPSEIEQLTARVRELEEENTALVKTIQRDTLTSLRQLAASQEYAEQLREKIEALWDIIDDIDSYGDMAKADDKLFRSLVEKRQKDRWETGITTDGYVLNMPIPRDTSALDAYVAEKVKAARSIDEKQIAYLFEERLTLTRQRDLAVEAMKMAVEMIETNAHERRHVRWKLNDALSTIKGSEK